MLSFATISLLAMATVMAILVSVVSRVLLRPNAASPSHAAQRRAGLRLALSVLIAGAALAVFVEVADNVLDQDELARLDGYVMSTLQPVRTATGMAMARGVSLLGTFAFMTLLVAAVALIVHRRRWRAVLAGWALVVGGGQLVEQLLKHTFHRTRPAGAGRYLVTTSFSYPSGHSMGSMIGYGVLAYLVLLRVRGRWARAAITALAALVMLAVGTSRLVLGVHYFTDVVGGFAVGAMWLALSIAIMEAQRWRVVDGSKAVPGPPLPRDGARQA